MNSAETKSCRWSLSAMPPTIARCISTASRDYRPCASIALRRVEPFSPAVVSVITTVPGAVGKHLAIDHAICRSFSISSTQPSASPCSERSSHASDHAVRQRRHEAGRVARKPGGATSERRSRQSRGSRANRWQRKWNHRDQFSRRRKYIGRPGPASIQALSRYACSSNMDWPCAPSAGWNDAGKRPPFHISIQAVNTVLLASNQMRPLSSS